MSECVVRMELRKNCLDCDLHQIVYGDSYADTDVYCFKEKRFVGKRFGPTKDLDRPSWCPIICQLPDWHGRLADKDLLMRDLDFLNTFGTPDDGKELSYEDILVTIDDFPTIVPAEAESPSPKPTDPLPIRGVEYVPTEVDVQTGTVTYELRERSETCLD